MRGNHEQGGGNQNFEFDSERDNNLDVAAFATHAFDKIRRRLRRENAQKEKSQEEFRDSIYRPNEENSYSSKEAKREKVTGRIAVEQAQREYESPDRSADEEIISESKIYIPESLKSVDWQVECFEQIKRESNVILSAPTGSGKTRVFMEWANEKRHEAENNGEKSTVYITAPIKALSNQRFRELKEQGLNVGLETGDVKNVPDNADYICCTQEIFTNKYCDDESATLIVDEFHYMFENPDRQRAYIDGLHNTKAKNILTCSATMGDMSKTVNYVDKVSGRDFTSYETEETLTDKTFEGEISPGNIKNAFVVAFSVNKILGINKTLCRRREESRSEFLKTLSDDEKEQENLKFKQKQTQIQKLAEKYQVEPQSGMEYGVANYYGRMLPKEKLFVEELFENKLIDTVVGTDALALGVNFPIENVVFTQLMKYQGRGNDALRITKNQFDQLCGRAGRKGYFDEGHIYYSTDFRDIKGYPTEETFFDYDENYDEDLYGEEHDEYRRFRYDTEGIFDELIDEENESISVRLGPNMRELLSGRRSVEDEANYIVKFSTEYSESSSQKIKDSLEWELSNILDHTVDEDYPEYDEEYRNGIAEAYDETISSSKNRDLFSRVIQDSHAEDADGQKLSTASLFDIYMEHADNFNEMLQFRKYVHGLPKQYRKMYNLAGLDTIINRRDHTALNSERGAVQTSEIEDVDHKDTDYELLTRLYDFSTLKDEVYEAIENDKVSAEKIFSTLDTDDQWEYFEKFKDDFGCEIDINDVLQNMYVEDDRNVFGEYFLRENLLTIYRLGGNVKHWLEETNKYYYTLDTDDREAYSLDLLVEAADDIDFERNLSHIANGALQPSKDTVRQKIMKDYFTFSGDTICNTKTWNYLTKECGLDKTTLLDKNGKLGPERASKLLKIEGISHEDLLDRLVSCHRPDQKFDEMVALGFSAEDLYKRYVSNDSLEGNDVATLLGYGIPAQKIVDDITHTETLFDLAGQLTKAGGNIPKERLLEYYDDWRTYELTEIERGIEVGLTPSEITNKMEPGARIESMDSLKEIGIKIDINNEIKKCDPWTLYHIGIDFLLDHGADVDAIKNVVEDEKLYNVNEHSSAHTGADWKERVDDIVRKREAA